MGLIHSRASKKRAKAEAELLKEQTKQVKAERKAQERAAQADLPAWRQPTLGGAIAAARRNRRGDGDGAEPGL